MKDLFLREPRQEGYIEHIEEFFCRGLKKVGAVEPLIEVLGLELCSGSGQLEAITLLGRDEELAMKQNIPFTPSP